MSIDCCQPSKKKAPASSKPKHDHDDLNYNHDNIQGDNDSIDVLNDIQGGNDSGEDVPIL